MSNGLQEKEALANEVNPTEESVAESPVVEEEEEPIVELLPALLKICECESGLRQFNEDGTVLKGRVNPLDRGICQINLKYHGSTAESMGLDVNTLEGNIKYANWLYEQQGAKPWIWSAPCHGRY